MASLGHSELISVDTRLCELFENHENADNAENKLLAVTPFYWQIFAKQATNLRYRFK